MDMLQTGAMHRAIMSSVSDWQPIATAPRDRNVVIEVMCTYGTAPWYALARWLPPDTPRQMLVKMPDGTDKIIEIGGFTSVGMNSYGWEILNTGSALTAGGVMAADDRTLQWRPYNGTIENYRDPTGGMQGSDAYWRGAVASKYGLPLNAFEKKQSLWSWLFWPWLFG